MLGKLKIVTTSWDDGDPADIRVAELLRSKGIHGTFYVSLKGRHGKSLVEPAHIRRVSSEGFEVGAHGVTHRNLPGLNAEDLDREVRSCKNWLEDILGERVRMFCYPRGRFNAGVVRHVKDAGYEGARTTRMLRQRLDFDPFQMPTSLFAYPNKRKMYAKNLIKGRNIRGLFDYVTRFIRLESWVSMGKILFDQVLKEGGVWHLYGHSWQIEEMGLWDDLKEILDYVCRREGVLYLTNAEALTFLPGKTPATPPTLNLTALR